MNPITGWPAVIILISLLSVTATFAVLLTNWRRQARVAMRPRLRLLDRQPVPKLTRDVEREFQYRVMTQGIGPALEWLAEFWNVEVLR